MFEPFITDLKDAAKENVFFRSVLFTGANSQLVLMSLAAGEEIGNEVHKVDQLLVAINGEGKVVLDGAETKFEKGMVVCVPAGVYHNIINSNDEPMKLYTVYAPPQHAAGTVHKTKAEAEAAEKKVGQPALV